MNYSGIACLCDVSDMLKSRLTELKTYHSRLNRSLKRAPQGTLRISESNGKVRFYMRSGSETNGVYLSKKDTRQISALAQKKYDQKTLKAVDREIKSIEAMLLEMSMRPAEEVIELFHPELRHYVNPVIESDEEFVAGWYRTSDTCVILPPTKDELITLKGESVRSKSELIIANMLYQMEVPYMYEHPAFLSDGRTYYPDFTALNIRRRKEVMWEHAGMVDMADYESNFVRKYNNYTLNGLLPGEDVIYTFEGSEEVLNTRVVEFMIRRYLL
ncbi:MAG: hypothetical protein IJS22_04330 [Lachnospiraceae bacterium]|nr:hypothetical protein [Lachnospiraceae bacterium]